MDEELEDSLSKARIVGQGGVRVIVIGSLWKWPRRWWGWRGSKAKVKVRYFGGRVCFGRLSPKLLAPHYFELYRI